VSIGRAIRARRRSAAWIFQFYAENRGLQFVEAAVHGGCFVVVFHGLAVIAQPAQAPVRSGSLVTPRRIAPSAEDFLVG
jgi:hypothetical protein